MLYSPKDKKTPSSGPGHRWLRPALLIIFAGGAAAAIAAFFVQKKDLALGLLAGSLLSILNFSVLHSLADKVLKAGLRGRRVFWFWTLLRWILAAMICWGLVRISPSCLLGALGGYLWALLVLGWMGLRSAASTRTS